MIKPNGARVIVKRKEAEDEMNGILIPDAAKELSHEGTVRYAGEQSVFEPGQMVVFGKFAGTQIMEDGEELLILSDEQIMCVRAA